MKNEALWNERTKAMAKPPIEEAKTFTQEYIPELELLEVDDDEGMSLANTLLKEVKRRHKTIEAAKKRILDPLNQARTEVMGLFNPPLKLLKGFEQQIKDKIARAVEASYQEQQKALTEAADASMRGDTEAAVEAMTRASQAELSAQPGLSLRHTWDFEIVDEKKIPREYLVIDASAIKAAIKASDGKVEIPGIEPVRKTSVASRAS